MQRLLEAGLTVLLVSTIAVPAKSNPEPINSTNDSQPTITQTTPPKVEAKKIDAGQVEAVKQIETTELSERDRLNLERYLQRSLPSGVVRNQLSDI